MGDLGSIFDAVSTSGEAKGPDLRVQATVSRASLESSDGVIIPVPDRVPHGSGSVPRRRGPDDPAGGVRLHLSKRLDDKATLRLRGQGGEHPESGTPGDLLLEITLVRTSGRGWLLPLLLVAAVALGLGAWRLWGG